MNGTPTMTDVPTLDALVADPGLVRELPAPVVHHLLVQVTSLLPLLVAHAHMPTSEKPHQEDRLLTVAEACVKLGMSKDYVYRHAGTFPFTVRVSPRQLRFSLNGIERYIRQRA